VRTAEVIATHSGSRWPLAMFAVTLLLTGPRVITSPGASRWAWLAVSIAIVVVIVRGMLVGRVRLSSTHLEVRTVLRTRRFRRSDVCRVSVQRTRVGIAGVTRDALAVETSAGTTVISDVNVASGSGLLDRICEKVNEGLRT